MPKDYMPMLQPHLSLGRCPLCMVARPLLTAVWNGNTNNHAGTNQRAWSTYQCASCGGIVTATAPSHGAVTTEIYPNSMMIEEAIPVPARTYLEQALESLHAPAGALMLAASAVDAMLKARDYKTGTLYQRIEKAASDHLITQEMAEWAHEVRLDANDQRHADFSASLPDQKAARRSLDFALALGTILFTLPASVERGRRDVDGA